MFATRVKETTTTTGTGNITLLGAATRFRTLYEVFGTYRRCSYYIEDRTNNVWEKGVGYLTNSTTFVRDVIEENSSGTTSALTLASGTKDFFCGASSSSYFSGADSMTTGGNLVFSMHLMTYSTTGTAPTALKMYYIPYFNTITQPITAMGVIVVTGAATKVAAMGIYDIKDGLPSNLLRTHAGTVDMSATGILTATLTSPITLPIGWCFVGFVSDTTGGTRFNASGTGTKGCTFLGVDSNGTPIAHLYETLGVATSVPTTVGSLTAANANTPNIGLIS